MAPLRISWLRRLRGVKILTATALVMRWTRRKSQPKNPTCSALVRVCERTKAPELNDGAFYVRWKFDMARSVEVLWQRAMRYLNGGQRLPARAMLEAILTQDPTHLDAHLSLARMDWASGRVRSAVRSALAAAKLVNGEPGAIIATVTVLLQVGEMATAHELLALATRALGSLDGSDLLRLAGEYQSLGQHVDALACFERARAVGMDGVQFRFMHAMELAFNGRLEDAASELESCIASGASFGRIFVEAARLRCATPADNHLSTIDVRLAAAPPDSEDRAALEFARYKELEDLHRFEEAWTALSNGNTTMARRLRHDPVRAAELLDRQLGMCTDEFLRSDDMAHEDEPQPIFIIGMTRSGTTLLDRLLGAHPDVRSAGELRDFGQQLRWGADNPSRLAPDEVMLARLPALDYAELGRRYLEQTRWRANSRRYFIDKRPENWIVAGLISKALPRARILNMVRDPMDVCFSNFRAFFSGAYPWSYDLDVLAAHYRQYALATQHWHRVLPGRILDVSYAELVRDPESTMRGVLAHCDLAWDRACLDLSSNEAPVATLSFDQVRQAVHQRSFKAWQPYANHLEPLRAALQDL